MEKYMEQFRSQFKNVQPFSGTTALLLGLFSWFVYLLIREPAVKELVAITGWFFIIVGTDWVLFRKTVGIPLLELKVAYGPWVTGALISAGLLSYDFLVTDFPAALVSWPIFSGIVAAIPFLLKTGPQVKQYKDFLLFERQYLVNLALISVLLSCWFQFHFILDDLLQQYPSLLADRNITNSAFVVRTNQPPVTKGVTIVDTAEAMIREELRRGELRGRSWADGQRLLLNVQTDTSPIRPRTMAPVIADKVFGNTPGAAEAPLWFYNAQFYGSNTDNSPGSQSSQYGSLVLQAIWRGPSSYANGYRIEKNCLIPRDPPVRPIRGLERPKELSFYLLDCQPVTSTPGGITLNRAVEPVQPDWWRRLRRDGN
jgi:Family of unknown function (DUF5357)